MRSLRVSGIVLGVASMFSQTISCINDVQVAFACRSSIFWVPLLIEPAVNVRDYLRSC